MNGDDPVPGVEEPTKLSTLGVPRGASGRVKRQVRQWVPNDATKLRAAEYSKKAGASISIKVNWLTSAVGGEKLQVGERKVIQGRCLADGGFAYVHEGKDAQTGAAVAIRRVLCQDDDARKKMHEEVALLEGLPKDPHIVEFLGASILSPGSDSMQAVQLFELCTGGTLLQWLEAAMAGGGVDVQKDIAKKGYLVPCLPSEVTLDTLEGLSGALAHLHTQCPPVIHYDVKSENVLFGADGTPKLCDFGSASTRTFAYAAEGSRKAVFEVEEFVHGRCTPIYRAPECADPHLRWPIGTKVDVFALGCVLYAMLLGVHPFPMDSALANVQAKYTIPDEASASYPKALVRWCRRLLSREPSFRPESVELEAEIGRFRVSGEDPPDADVAEQTGKKRAQPPRGKSVTKSKQKAAPVDEWCPDWPAETGATQATTLQTDWAAWAPASAPSGDAEAMQADWADFSKAEPDIAEGANHVEAEAGWANFSEAPVIPMADAAAISEPNVAQSVGPEKIDVQVDGAPNSHVVTGKSPGAVADSSHHVTEMPDASFTHKDVDQIRATSADRAKADSASSSKASQAEETQVAAVEKKIKEEQDRKAREEQERKMKEEQARKVAEENARQMKAEQDRKERELTEEKARQSDAEASSSKKDVTNVTPVQTSQPPKQKRKCPCLCGSVRTKD